MPSIYFLTIKWEGDNYLQVGEHDEGKVPTAQVLGENRKAETKGRTQK